MAVLCLKSNYILHHFSSIFLPVSDAFTLIKIGSICQELKTR